MQKSKRVIMKFRRISSILAIFLLLFCVIYPVAAADAASADSPEQFYNMGEIALEAGKYDSAIAYYDQALASNTTLMQKAGSMLYIFRDKAYAQIQLGLYADSINTLDQGLALFPNDSMLWNNKGYAFFRLGKLQDALDAYDKAISLDQSYTNALINKGNALYQMGRYQDAVDAYNKALESDPGNNVATAGLADAQKAAASAVPLVPLALVVILIIVAGGVVWYVKCHRPAEQKQPEKGIEEKKKE